MVIGLGPILEIACINVIVTIMMVHAANLARKPNNAPWNKDTCERQRLEHPKTIHIGVVLRYVRATFVHLPGKAHVKTYPGHRSKSRNTHFGDKDDPCGLQHLQHPNLKPTHTVDR
jgi:hypothetical protein